MTTEFYLCQASFSFKLGVTKEILNGRIEELMELTKKIKDKNEIIFKHDTIYYQFFYEQVLLCDALYQDGTDILGKNQKKALMKILDHAKSCDLPIDNFIAQLGTYCSNRLYGLICLHEINAVEQQYLIYRLMDWYCYHRYALGKFSLSESDFAEGIEKCFDSIFFHVNICSSLSTLEGGLNNFKQEIIRNLTALNDDFCKHRIPDDRVRSLRQFSAACGVEVTTEGDASRKSTLTFSFLNSKNGLEMVCCEPHMKLVKSNAPGDTHYYFNRIYFHEGKPNIADGKILVGHIGKHL